MTQTDIQELVCTDQLRKGSKLGLVLEAKGAIIRVHWDGDAEATSYSREEIGELRTVTIERRAPRSMRDGMTRAFFTRIFGQE
jgi:hypothetical protein